MTPFERATFNDPVIAGLAGGHEVYLNDTYQVVVRRKYRLGKPEDGFPEMVHLSIKRIDKEPIRDWRDFQQIKNELVGAEHEGAELFPAESRLVDTANQYHLWVLADATARFPFGFHEGRLVSDAPTDRGAKQRPFENSPTDNVAAQEMERRVKEFMDPRCWKEDRLRKELEFAEDRVREAQDWFQRLRREAKQRRKA